MERFQGFLCGLVFGFFAIVSFNNGHPIFGLIFGVIALIGFGVAFERKKWNYKGSTHHFKRE